MYDILNVCFVGRGQNGKNYSAIKKIKCPDDQDRGTAVKSMV